MAFIELVSFCYPSPKILNNIGSLVKMPSVTGIYLRRTSLSWLCRILWWSSQKRACAHLAALGLANQEILLPSTAETTIILPDVTGVQLIIIWFFLAYYAFCVFFVRTLRPSFASTPFEYLVKLTPGEFFFATALLYAYALAYYFFGQEIVFTDKFSLRDSCILFFPAIWPIFCILIVKTRLFSALPALIRALSVYGLIYSVHYTLGEVWSPIDTFWRRINIHAYEGIFMDNLVCALPNAEWRVVWSREVLADAVQAQINDRISGSSCTASEQEEFLKLFGLEVENVVEVWQTRGSGAAQNLFDERWAACRAEISARSTWQSYIWRLLTAPHKDQLDEMYQAMRTLSVWWISYFEWDNLVYEACPTERWRNAAIYRLSLRLLSDKIPLAEELMAVAGLICLLCLKLRGG